jgi:hypothetical protein
LVQHSRAVPLGEVRQEKVAGGGERLPQAVEPEGLRHLPQIAALVNRLRTPPPPNPLF